MSRALAFGDACLRGLGQVVFMNHPVTGALILVALVVASPWLGVATAVGLVASTAAAHALAVDRGAIGVGLYGFNGCLIGAALATFLEPDWSVAVLAWTVVLAAGTSVVTAAVGSVLVRAWDIPPLTLPFNLVALAFLAAVIGTDPDAAGPLLAPRELGGAVDTTLRAAADGPPAGDLEGLLNALWRGIGQLFFADHVVSGILIVVAIAVYSRIAAAFALLGTAVGTLTGLVLGADGFAVYHGLWGYNGFVAAVGVAGIFLVLTVRTALLAVACAVAASVLFGALGTLLAPWGLPALTLPFVLATFAFLALKDASEGVRAIPLGDVTRPEEHRG